MRWAGSVIGVSWSVGLRWSVAGAEATVVTSVPVDVAEAVAEAVGVGDAVLPGRLPESSLEPNAPAYRSRQNRLNRT